MMIGQIPYGLRACEASKIIEKCKQNRFRHYSVLNTDAAGYMLGLIGGIGAIVGPILGAARSGLKIEDCTDEKHPHCLSISPMDESFNPIPYVFIGAIVSVVATVVLIKCYDIRQDRKAAAEEQAYQNAEKFLSAYQENEYKFLSNEHVFKILARIDRKACDKMLALMNVRQLEYAKQHANIGKYVQEYLKKHPIADPCELQNKQDRRAELETSCWNSLSCALEGKGNELDLKTAYNKYGSLFEEDQSPLEYFIGKKITRDNFKLIEAFASSNKLKHLEQACEDFITSKEKEISRGLVVQALIKESIDEVFKRRQKHLDSLDAVALG